MAKPNLEGLRVAALVADGVEQVELTKPREVLEDAGAEVEVVSLRPGSIRAMNLMKPGKRIEVDRTILTAQPDHYDALLLPGGHFSPDLLRQSDQALEFVREFDRAQKPVAVICHGPWVLVSADLVRGRRLTSWPAIQDDVRNAGGAWRDEAVVRDGNWVSSRGPQDLRKFCGAMLELFAESAPYTDVDTGGGIGVGRLVAGGLALAAISYGIRQWQGSPDESGYESFRGVSTAHTHDHVEADVVL
ncbi:MAG TPA: type 1 glutamine amidotransferase domain-containing protein [Longimicrobiaceae bacterium]|nr:type 1 glutamine amidotransferase domain-containing protein [Longimicrobiaceae bacterium]